MFKIGTLKIASRFILAPLASISDLPFRLLNRRFGCDFAFVEMINARCLGYKSAKTRQLLTTTAEDRPLGVQLLGCEETFVERAMDIITRYRFDILDFNAACPERKVVRRGEGAALMKDPAKLKKLLSIVVKHSPVPVTVKLRAGWDARTLTARECALAAEDAGVQAVCVHGRTQNQHYAGTVNYESIAQVKKSLHIPVIGSGDVFSASLARKMFDQTGCDAVLVARGALGNPWIFQELKSFFATEQLPARPGSAEIAEMMLRHLDLCIEYHGERVGVVVFRKFFIWYTWGLASTRHLREAGTRSRTREDMVRVIEEFKLLKIERQGMRSHNERLSILPA
ncbi:MAG TPA: tRNA dihydrouridine synthase DusB [Candidatus Omnitrophota bacterium]|nr:tRNA dihydrouridine synthase DusB [Candidatus Omnitrophota bacterium]